MIGLHSALLNKDEKMILKDALFLYVSDLQKRYYGDKLIEEKVYLEKMKEVESIVDKLHLTELYRWLLSIGIPNGIFGIPFLMNR